MSLVTLLMQLVGPLVIRALLTIGFTAITFTGVQAAVNAVISQAQSSWSSLPAAVLQLASLAGVPEGIGLICGAFVARVTLWAVAQSVKLVFTGHA